jgi:predicted dehydrogenase
MTGGGLSLLRLAVIGLGPMGQNHVRAIADTPGAKLAAVVDIDSRVAAATAATFACLAHGDSRAVIGEVDAAIIAVPPADHAGVAVPLLRAGIHCLIEKPLAPTPEQATAIAAAAGAAVAGQGVVAVGHIERFNPALEPVLALNLMPTEIMRIDAVRTAPRGGRAVATDVVSDMMVHDLDVAVKLKGGDVTEVEAQGDPATAVDACLRYADGTHVRLRADRAAESRERTFRIETRAQAIEVDFLARRARCDGRDLPVTPHDALRAQLADFLEAARLSRAPRVTLDDARASLALVWRIHAALAQARS